MTQTTGALKDAVEQFLYQEAAYMDLHCYDEWFGLWADDLQYWVPCNVDQYNPARHVSLIFDNRTRLEERIFRLKSKLIHSQTPRSRISRVISNVRVTQPVSQDLVEVSSNFLLTEARLDEVVHWAGRQTHHLVVAGDSLKIQQKTIYLVNNDAVLTNLTFLI